MAPSLSSRARPFGRRRLKPICPNGRQTCTVLKLGPQSLTMKYCTRGSIHTSAAKPCRLALARRAWRRRSSSRSSIVLFWPKGHIASSCFASASAQRLTDCRLTFSRRAIPASNSFRAVTVGPAALPVDLLPDWHSYALDNASGTWMSLFYATLNKCRQLGGAGSGS